MRKILTNFRGGEVSDRVAGRMDSQDYDQTCRTLENFLLHPSGGADLRPGTYYCGETCAQSDIVRLIPFVRSKTEAYVLELTDYIIRIWKDGALVQSGGEDLMITTPWAEADLFELKYAQTEDAIYFAHPDYQLTKLVYGTSNAWALVNADFSMFLALGTEGSPYTNFYSYSNGIFEKKAAPATPPTGEGYVPAFSPDGLYLAVPHTTDPYVSIYKRSGDVFTKLADPATKPTGNAYGCAFSPDGVYLAVAHNTDPYITIYKRSGDTFTKLDDPATKPTGLGSRCSFSKDGVYLAVAHTTSPYITIYKRSGDTFTKLDNPGTLPTGTGKECHFSNDGVYLAVAHATSPYITIYKRSGDVFSKLTNPAALPNDTGKGCAFSPNGLFLAVGHETGKLTIYKRTGDIFIKLANPATMPTGAVESCSFSYDSLYLAAAHGVSPYVTIYEIDVETFTKLDNPATLPDGVGNGCAFALDGWVGVPWATKYPSALTFHEQRLVVARGRKVWASRVGFLQDFRIDAADTSYGYEYKFAANQLEDVLWMLTKNHNIILGSGMGEWLMTGGDAPLTAANVYVDRVSAHGSANIAAVMANESILFVQDGAQRLREFLYSQERGGYISPDLSRWADHIGRENFVELAWQRSPASLLWIVRGNGELAALTLDRNYSIQAWHRHPTDGTVESAAVIPGAAEDIVYMAVERTIGGDPKKYIEYLKLIDWGDDEEDCFFVDCGITIDHTATTDSIEDATAAEPVVITASAHPFVNDEFVKITGVVGMTELNGNTYMVKNKFVDDFELYETDGTTPLDGTGFTAYVSGGTCVKVVKAVPGLTHLEGKTVAVYADGVELGDEVVDTGSITIDEYASKIHVGLPYTGKLRPQRLGQFLKSKIQETVLMLYKTRGGKIGSNEDNLNAIQHASSALLTGTVDARIQGTFSREGDLIIVQDQPLPMTVLAIAAELNAN